MKGYLKVNEIKAEIIFHSESIIFVLALCIVY